MRQSLILFIGLVLSVIGLAGCELAGGWSNSRHWYHWAHYLDGI
jgi:hypothetical protein